MRRTCKSETERDKTRKRNCKTENEEEEKKK
jgi:hypothetical protein